MSSSFLIRKKYFEDLGTANVPKFLIGKQLSKLTYTVHLVLNEGSYPTDTIIVEFGNEPELPVPVRSGYKFMGWYADADLTIQVTQFNMSITYIYAKWEEKTQSYEVDLNNQWRRPAQFNPDDYPIFNGFDVYESFSNYHVQSSKADMYIDVTGYQTFTLYINSYAESRYDYTEVWADGRSLGNTISYQYNPTQYAPDSGTGWKTATYQVPQDGLTHRLTIRYNKDSSTDSNWDRGYVAIKRDQ